jgi:hypothetical protein
MIRYAVKDAAPEAAWSRIWPTKPGKYWAWGERIRNQNRPELMYVEVSKVSNGVMRVTRGELLLIPETGELLWTPAYVPCTPTADDVLTARNKFNAQKLQTV